MALPDRGPGAAGGTARTLEDLRTALAQLAPAAIDVAEAWRTQQERQAEEGPPSSERRGHKRTVGTRPRRVRAGWLAWAPLALAVALAALGLDWGLGSRSGGGGPAPIGLEHADIRAGLVDVTFLDASHGFGVYLPTETTGTFAAQEIVATDDGGADWRVVGRAPLAGDPSGNAEIAFANASAGWFWQDGEAFATSDGGSSWKTLDLTGRVARVAVGGGSVWVETDLCASSKGPSECHVGLYASLPDLRHWRPIAGLPALSSTGGNLVVVSSRVVYVPLAVPSRSDGLEAAPLEVEVTDDGGATWQDEPLPCRAPFATSTALSRAPGGALWLVCVGVNGDKAVFTQGRAVGQPTGSRWSVDWTFRSESITGSNGYGSGNAPSGRFVDLQALSGMDAVMFSNADSGAPVARTTDGGRTWRSASLSMAESGSPLAFANGRDGWVSFFGAGLWRTTDGGASWSMDPRFSVPEATSANVPDLGRLQAVARQIVRREDGQNVHSGYAVWTTPGLIAFSDILGGGTSATHYWLLAIPGRFVWQPVAPPPGWQPGRPHASILLDLVGGGAKGSIGTLPDLRAYGPAYRITF